jgi:predicted RecB family nuclease
LTLVPNIARNQIRRLWDAGVSTVRTLAGLPVGSRVPGIQAETLDRLRHQATLQIAKRDPDENHVETFPTAAGKGFARLLRPNAGDIFFDMEGAQFFGDGGLEYLVGFVTIDDGEPTSRPFRRMIGRPRSAPSRKPWISSHWRIAN